MTDPVADTERPPPIVAPAPGLNVLEDRAVPLSVPPATDRLSVSPQTMDSLFLELQQLRQGLSGEQERDSRMRDTQIAVMALQEQAAAIASGVTAVLHFLAPIDEARPLANKRVLLVEDETTLIPAYLRMLEGWGARAEARTTYLEANHWLDSADNFDVAVLDVKLPGGSGIDLAARIADEWPNVAIVLTTGFMSETYRVQAARVGADILNKPHNPDVLLRAIKKQIGRLQS